MSGERSGRGDHGKSDRHAGKRVGKFEVLEQIGRGATGAVFRARQLTMDRIVALKILPPSLARNKGFIARFLREAQAAAHLNHPNIVQAIDAGKAGAYYYFAMELVDGPSAGELVKRIGMLPEERAVEIARDCARGLAHAHEHGIIHRDVKPDNVLIAPDGTPKIADLGLARRRQRTDSQMTQSGLTLGTPDYISPEQAKGRDDTDGRTDVYSLAGTFYHLLTGQPPFAGSSAVEVMSKHLHERPPDPRTIRPSVSAGSAAVIRKGMAKRPGDRYPSAAALADALDAVLSKTDSTASMPAAGKSLTVPADDAAATGTGSPESPRARAHRRSRRRKWIAGATTAAALIALAAAGVVFLGKGGPLSSDTTDTRSGTGAAPTGPALLDHVAAQVARHPEDYRAGLANWDRAIEQLADRPDLRDKAKRARAALHVRYRKAAQAELKRVNDAAQELAARDDFDGALATYDGLPDQFAELLPDDLENRRSDLRARAERQVRALLAEARKLAEAGRTSDARARLKAAQAIRYTPLDDELANLRKQLASAEAKPDRDAPRDDPARARRKLAELLDRMEAAAGEGNLGAAAQLAREAKADEIYRSAADRLDAVLEMADALDRATAARTLPLREALGPHLGGPIRVRTREGRVIEGELTKLGEQGLVVDKEYFVMGEEKHREYRVPYGDVAPETAARLRPRWEPRTPAGHAALALIAAGQDDGPRLAAAVAELEDHPLRDRFEAKLEELGAAPRKHVRPEAESAAKTAWAAKIEPLLGREEWVGAGAGRALALLDGYQAKHGDTAFARARGPEIARLRRAAMEARVSADARRAWGKIVKYVRARRQISPAGARSLWAALAKFDEQYGGSAFAASVGHRMALLRERIYPHLPRIRFRSELPLTVLVQRSEAGSFGARLRHAGETPADGGVELREGPLWCVKPARIKGFSDTDLRRLAAECRAQGIPGLALQGNTFREQFVAFTDSSLACLEDCRHLRYLNLEYASTIGDDGMASVGKLTGLRYLNLGYCRRLGDEGLRHLSELTELRGLWIHWDRKLTHGGLDVLKNFKKLRVLSLTQARGVTGGGLKSLAGLPNLRRLSLGGLDLRGDCMKSIARLPSLRRLYIRDARVKGADLAPLASLPKLELLQAGRQHSPPYTWRGDESMAVIARCEALKALGLARLPITDAGVEHLAKLKNLRRLDLSGCDKLSDRCVIHLRGMRSLTWVNLTGTGVSAAALSALREARPDIEITP